MKRYAAGRLNGVFAEPGTIFGPNDTKEFMVVIEQDERGVVVGYAQEGDIEAAMEEDSPRSYAEYKIRKVRQ
jgi:hypothetical protein